MIQAQRELSSMGIIIRYSTQIGAIESQVLYEIAKLVAEKFVSEHYQEIAALISQEAIATLAVAESASKIRESLEKKIPDKILEIVRRK